MSRRRRVVTNYEPRGVIELDRGELEMLGRVENSFNSCLPNIGIIPKLCRLFALLFMYTGGVSTYCCCEVRLAVHTTYRLMQRRRHTSHLYYH